MNQPRTISAALAITLVSGSALGGQLAPPVGPVAPSMKTLTDLDPRIIINDLPGDADSVHLITAPGRYVLRAGIPVGAGKHGIEVVIPPGVVGEVSIDLNDFTIEGEPGSLDGVRRSGETISGDFVLTKGSIERMGGDGVHVESGAEASILGVSVTNCGDDGIDISNTTHCTVASAERFGGKYLVQGCTHRGLNIADCGSVDIEGIDASENGEHGVSVENSGFVRIRETDANRNDGDGVRFINVTAVAKVAAEKADIGAIRAGLNAGAGLRLDSVGSVSVLGSTFSDNGGDGAAVRHDPLNRPAILNFTCEFSNNARDGMSLVWSPKSNVSLTLDDCRAFANGDAGMNASWEPGDPTKTGGRVGITLSDSIFDSNGLDGVTLNRDRSKSLDMRVEECSFSNNTRDGLKSYFETGDVPTEEQFADLIDCRANSNGFIGINCETKNVTLSNCEASSNLGDGAKFTTNSPGHKTVCEVSLRASHNGGNGMVFEGPLDASVRKSAAVGNGFSAPAVPGAGILSNALGRLHVSETRCTDNAGHGIAIADLDRDGALDLVYCAGNGGSGISMHTFTGLPCGRLSLRQCTAQNNLAHGLDLQCSSGGDVRECVFRGNGGLGTSASGTGHVFVWNTAADNALGPYIIPVPGNSVGPAVEEPFMSTDQHPHANFVR